MKIKKAVITAAGLDQRHLPLQTLVTPSGETKSVMSLILDEIFSTEIESVAIIITPESQRDFIVAVDKHLDRVTFIEQEKPLGYGHAVLQAKAFVEKEPFLLMMSDHLYLSQSKIPWLKSLLSVAEQTGCPVSAVQATHESKLPYYGAVAGKRINGKADLYEISAALEKPTPTLAEQELIVPGLRSGHYLCFFGMHILNDSVMKHLEKSLEDSPEKLPLTPSINATAKSERFLACEIQGLRFNIGEPYGLLRAQLAMALASDQRDEVMSSIIELISSTKS